MNSIKKILLVGAFSPDPSIYTYAQSFVSALSLLGFHVMPFNYRKKASWWGTLNAWWCNNALIRAVTTYKPDLVFIIKGELLTPETLCCIKQICGSRLINFYPDNPFVVWNGNSNEHVLASLPIYDCWLSWSKMLEPVLISAGCKHVCYFPFAYDETLFNKSLSITNNDYAQYASDVCFVGTWEPEREAWLNDLITCMPSISLAVWGNDWVTKCHNAAIKKILRGSAIYGDSMIKAFRLSKIVLNFIRVQNLAAHNMRTLEVPASGAFLLTQRTQDQAETLFKEGESIACFADSKELVNKIDFYLHNANERIRIANNGFARAGMFTLTKQLQQYFNQCCLYL